MSYKQIIESGVNAAHTNICDVNKIWSHYSNDKVDIGEELAGVIRILNKALPLDLKLRGLSIGSSDEPQFRILQSAFRGGLYLLDIDTDAINVVKERIKRQCTDHVSAIKGDYNRILSRSKNIKYFFKNKLSARPVHLVALHHSLYYCRQCRWLEIFSRIYKDFLDKYGAIHAVLMASKSVNPYSTTWLYNHFAGKFFNAYNDQDLRVFKNDLQKKAVFKNARVLLRTSRVCFNVNEFEKFMKAVWMILLYPQVHKYSLAQREDITEFIYKNFWKKKQPLIQEQDHMVVYKGVPFKGFI